MITVTPSVTNGDFRFIKKPQPIIPTPYPEAMRAACGTGEANKNPKKG
jgi:hypothetical protein